MQMFLEEESSEIWKAVKDGPYIPITVVNGVGSSKPENSWDEEDHKKVLYDNKAKNIIAFAWGKDEFFRVSNCKTAKEIWKTSRT
jgi:hypothetical protein